MAKTYHCILKLEAFSQTPCLYEVKLTRNLVVFRDEMISGAGNAGGALMLPVSFKPEKCPVF